MKVQLAALALTASSICMAAPAQAACGQFAFNGFHAINQSNGYRIEFNSTGTQAGGPVTAFDNHQAPVMHGTISGGISGREVNLLVQWGTADGHYEGGIDSEGGARGNTWQAQRFAQATWTLREPFVCADSGPEGVENNHTPNPFGN